MVEYSFEPNADIAARAEAYGLDMVDYAMNQFGLLLDWSDESIKVLEDCGDRLHGMFLHDKPSEEDAAPVFRAIGSYLGEVLRKSHGAEWGLVELNGQKFDGMRSPRGTCFWPVGKARGRVVNGHEDNLWDYLRFLLKEQF